MAKQKFDGIIEAVHYNKEGQIDWVRAFLRRGPTWSDWTLINRGELIDQLKNGKRFVVGKRIEYLGTTFKTDSTIKLISSNDHNIIVAGEIQSEMDNLEGVPIL
jgi:hypothetical protein